MKKVKSTEIIGAERTRRSIVKLLKHNGSMDAHQLSSELGVTAMAVRQHLYDLQEQDLVDFKEEQRSMGRPAKMWFLTAEANRLFPDGYATLTVSLIESMREAFGDEGLEKLLSVYSNKQLSEYQSKTAKHRTIREKLDAFAEARTAEGFMAEIISNVDGSFYIVEKHCPICEAARVCTDICRNELQMFQDVLGNEVEVTRGEHILQGDLRCVYKVTLV